MSRRGSSALSREERFRRVRIFSAITCLSILLFIPLRLLSQSYVTLGVLLTAEVIALVGQILLWLNRYPRLAAHATLIAATVAIGGSHVQDGMNQSVSLWVIAVVPISAGHLLESRAIPLYALFAAFFVSCAYLGPALGFIYPEQAHVSPMDWVVLRLVALVVLTLVGGQIAQDTESRVLKIARQKLEVDRAHERAQAYDAEKARFLSQMSYEIRTPMNGIKGMTQHWSRQALDGELRESVVVMDRCADHLMAMISDIQDLSKIERGGFDILIQPFLLNSAVGDVASLFEAKARSKGLQLQLEGPQEDYWCNGDPQRLIQVLSNLVGNAVKFTDEGQVRIRWSVEAESQVVFEVIDDGIGMSKDQLDKLFEEFSQVHLDDGVARGGTGLGLTISKALSEAMGGDLRASSEPGKGSVFRLRLELPQIEAPDGQCSEAQRSLPLTRSLSVLVVDDDQVSLLVQRLALERLNCKVEICDSPNKGIAAAQAEKFDLIIMDLRMPERDGFETLAQIRASSPLNQKTPVIALTASAAVEDRKRCLDMGMLDVIVKPFAFDTLARSVQGCRDLQLGEKEAA